MYLTTQTFMKSILEHISILLKDEKTLSYLKTETIQQRPNFVHIKCYALSTCQGLIDSLLKPAYLQTRTGWSLGHH